MCNCRNSTFVLITALITVYFSNIIFPKNYGNALFSGALFLGFASLMSLTAQQESLFSISQLLPFVKYFFQLFSKVFYSLIYPAARDSLIILSHLFHLVKGFFELFSKKIYASENRTHKTIFPIYYKASIKPLRRSALTLAPLSLG